MYNFFHVDSGKSLKKGQKIKLTHYYGIENKELEEHVNLLFPKGFSRHGITYFFHPNIIEFKESDLPSLLENNYIKTTSNSRNGIIEILFEYVRRSNFPDKSSRFQSLHAFKTIEDATKFRKEYCKNKGHIWEVKCDNFFKVDMNLLNLEGSLLELSYKIHKYWSGL